MNVWTLVLLALCVAGALFALAGVIMVLTLALQTGKRLQQLQESSFVTKLESMQIQIDRLSRIQEDVAPLQARLDAALQKMRQSFDATNDLRSAMSTVAGEVRAIVQELS